MHPPADCRSEGFLLSRNGRLAKAQRVLRNLDSHVLVRHIFHAWYAGQKTSISIDDLSVIDGKLAPRALGLVMEWASLHRGELRDAWREASRHETPDPIEPLG